VVNEPIKINKDEIKKINKDEMKPIENKPKKYQNPGDPPTWI